MKNLALFVVILAMAPGIARAVQHKCSVTCNDGTECSAAGPNSATCICEVTEMTQSGNIYGEKAKCTANITTVDDDRWTVGFSAGALLDAVTGPEFSIEEDGTEPGGPRFRIAADEGGSWAPGAAFMAHFASDYDLTRRRIRWVPVSLGIGVGDYSGPHLLVGTSLEVRGRFIVTAGAAIGRVERLPDGLDVGDLASDPNLLRDLPSKTEVAAFLAMSYRFGG